MAKVKYVGMAGAMSSAGVRFVKGVPYEVSKEVAEYLVSTFGEETFVAVDEAPEKVVEEKVEVVVEAPAEEEVEKPKRRRPAKKVIDEK